MVPRVAAMVELSHSFTVFVCSVFSHSFSITLTRDKLLDKMQHTPDNFLPVFDYPDALFDVLVGGAAILLKRILRGKQGKHAPRTRLPSSAS